MSAPTHRCPREVRVSVGVGAHEVGPGVTVAFPHGGYRIVRCTKALGHEGDCDPSGWPDAAIQGITAARAELTELRGRLRDLGDYWPALKETLDDAAGALTCVIVALHVDIERIRPRERTR